MNIGVIGIGFVGLPLAAAFADMGNVVHCLDVDKKKIDGLRKGRVPINEPGLDSLVRSGLERKLLRFTTDYDTVLADSEVVFIAVGTPPGADGAADLQYVECVAREIGARMTKPLIIANKSTVPVGTAERVRATVKEELKKRKKRVTFHVVSNPEFMAEGRAVKDMMEPSRVIVGTDNATVAKKMYALYKPFMLRQDRFYVMGVRDAELTKYTGNTNLAMKVSFINAIAGLADVLGADVKNIAEGIGSDPRIGDKFLHASCGYGGSCFPKDVKALIRFAEDHNLPEEYLRLFRAVEEVNEFQKKLIARKVLAHFEENVDGKTFALWGLAFKANTNDMRESAAITIVNELTSRGAKIRAYDPMATDEARRVYLKGNKRVTYESADKYKVLRDADALIVATETKEYRAVDTRRMKKLLAQPVIFDGRNLYDPEDLTDTGFTYYGIGRGVRMGF